VESVGVERVVLWDSVASESSIEVELGVIEVWEVRVILALDISDKGVTIDFVIEGLLKEVGPLGLKGIHGGVLSGGFSISVGFELVIDGLTGEVSGFLKGKGGGSEGSLLSINNSD
jgi:hypothetical protein